MKQSMASEPEPANGGEAISDEAISDEAIADEAISDG